MLSKLQNLGTSNKTLLWFESYLTNRQQFTRVATSLSEPLTITHGVPQDSILGPTLFRGVGVGGGGGGGLIKFLPLKRGWLLEGGGLFERMT